MERDTVKIAKLAEEYRAAYKEWEIKHKIAFGTDLKDGNEEEFNAAYLAHQAMEKARQALMDADK